MTIRQLVLADFDATIRDNPIVIVQFADPAVPPLGRIGIQLDNPAMFEKAAKKHPDVVFAQVDLPSQRELAVEFDAKQSGTWLVFREGLLVFKDTDVLLDSVFDGLIATTKALDMSVVRQKLAALERGGTRRPTP